MPESLEVFNEIALIHQELNEHGVMLEAIVSATGTEQRSIVLTELGKDRALRLIFLAVPSHPSQGEISKQLKAQGVRGTSEASVSRKLDHLEHDLKLVTQTGRTTKGKTYRHTKVALAWGLVRALRSGE